MPKIIEVAMPSLHFPQNKTVDDIQNLSSAVEEKRDKRLREAARKMEAHFIGLLVKQMEQTIPRENHKQNLVNMMFSRVMGDAIAERGGLGMSDVIYESLKRKENPDLTILNQLSDTPVIDPKIWMEEGQDE
ncbi:MAG: hypothetical protein D6677_12725 [Calditrichaeota bacterium]|nr:MAG: hypothetical protein D6677_12725 [Calditrichota bacterium]